MRRIKQTEIMKKNVCSYNFLPNCINHRGLKTNIKTCKSNKKMFQNRDLHYLSNIAV